MENIHSRNISEVKLTRRDDCGWGPEGAADGKPRLLAGKTLDDGTGTSLVTTRGAGLQEDPEGLCLGRV